MSKIRWTAIVLAGGKGTRMNSPLPKVLHPVAGQPMIKYIIQALRGAGVDEIRVVTGFGDTLVRPVVESLGGICYLQKEQLGTADAVRSANVDSLTNSVLIVNGDHPLITSVDFKQMMDAFTAGQNALSVISTVVKNPGAFGRIVRHQGEVAAIVEAKDASASTLQIREINTGIYLTRAETLQRFLPEIKNENVKREYYLTDLVELCRQAKEAVMAHACSPCVAFGVNDQRELARATRHVFQRKIRQLMDDGVVVIDPARTYIEPSATIGASSVVYPGVYVRGKTTIGSFCVLEPNVQIVDSEIHDSVQILAGSYIESSRVMSKCKIGPYARLRPETVLHEEVQIGNFVELKKTTMAAKSKAAHLTYLGDAEIGRESNIGCGTITCNYAVDRKKYKTKIGENVFVGSDCQFIAPVQIGDGAVIGSGSTITKDVPSGALAVARGRQFVKENYQPKNAAVAAGPEPKKE